MSVLLKCIRANTAAVGHSRGALWVHLCWTGRWKLWSLSGLIRYSGCLSFYKNEFMQLWLRVGVEERFLPKVHTKKKKKKPHVMNQAHVSCDDTADLPLNISHRGLKALSDSLSSVLSGLLDCSDVPAVGLTALHWGSSVIVKINT